MRFAAEEAALKGRPTDAADELVCAAQEKEDAGFYPKALQPSSVPIACSTGPLYTLSNRPDRGFCEAVCTNIQSLGFEFPMRQIGTEIMSPEKEET